MNSSYPVQTEMDWGSDNEPAQIPMSIKERMNNMKCIQRILPFVLVVCMLAGLCSAAAINAGEARAVIGADLSESEISTVYSAFGI